MTKVLAHNYYSYLTLFVTGAAIMVVELLGTRLLGPFYGVSLFVWSALITVTLISLAIGYRLGGSLADKALAGSGDDAAVRKAAARKLYLCILAAGIYIMLMPHMTAPVLKLTSPMGIRLGALTSATILFAVPLVLLSMATPYMVKLLTSELSRVGTNTGNLFAISTVGSFAGSILTGFVLIPSFGTRTILYIQALILVTVWMAWEMTNRHFLAVALAMPLVVFCISSALAHKGDAALTSSGARVVADIESFYGRIQVIDKGNQRLLAVNGSPQSGIDRKTGYSIFPYPYYLELANFIRPEAEDALVIGLGGGSISTRFTRYGLNVDSVEIDPKIYEVARNYFGFRSENVHIQDGRRFILNTDKKYDIVIIDAFTSDTPPFHLFTKEMFGQIRGVMKKDGVLGMNYPGYPGGRHSAMTGALYATLKEAFGNVRLFASARGEKMMNLVYFSSEGDLSIKRDIETAGIIEVRELLSGLLENELDPINAKSLVLTDEYNPMEFLGMPIFEAWRQRSQGFYLDNALLN